MPAIARPALALALATGLAGAAQAQDATAKLLSPEGNPVGVASLWNTFGGVLIELELTEAPEGEHGFHIHETGKCGPDFGAAGGHLGKGDAHHGLLAEKGPHAGDLPNLHVPESGTLTIEILAPLVKVPDSDGETAVEKVEGAAQALVGAQARLPLLDSDGAALVIHEGPDDYATDPAGDSGKRIACGVIEAM